MNYLGKVFILGNTGIGGLFGDGSDIRGIVIYKTAALEEAKRPAEQNPAIKAGRLAVEVHPRWLAKDLNLNK